MDIEKIIDLGFVEECEAWRITNRYFPSKIGGKPAWLDLKKLPNPAELKCSTCGNQKIFLCQIYAPIDDKIECFHRTIFVFICQTATCFQNNSAENISVYRSQLKRDNPFYMFNPSDEQEKLGEISTLTSLCFVCGCRGPLVCSRCKKASYCSAEHQKIDWKFHKKNCNKYDKTPEANEQPCNEILFPEYKLEIESQSFSDQQSICGIDNDDEIKENEQMESYKQLVAEGKDGVLKNVSDLEIALYANDDVKDKKFKQFKNTIQNYPEQVLRYERCGGPLWITEIEPNWQLSVENCEQCGKPRHFEFQIMPQMLNHLKNDKLDWGVLTIFTCPDSCSISGYAKEFVMKQDIIK